MAVSENNNQSKWSNLGEPEMVVALAAVVVGICALFVSFVQVQIMREEQHTSVLPRLRIEQHYSEGQYLRLLLVNNGLGPAVVKNVRMSIDEEPATTWSEVTETLVPDHTPGDLSLTYINGQILPAGEMVTFFSSLDTTFTEQLVDQMGRLVIQICYCSVYEDCWSMVRAYEQRTSSEPEGVRACPTLDENSFID